MDDSHPSLPTSHLLGSVPEFPPDNAVGRERGYQTLESPSVASHGRRHARSLEEYKNCGLGMKSSPPKGAEQQTTNNWKGVFSISSYTQYFNVDTDVVLNRLMSALYLINGGFFSKIDRNPHLYGLVWISTALVFVIAYLGNLPDVVASFILSFYWFSLLSFSGGNPHYHYRCCIRFLVALNHRSHVEGDDLTVGLVAAYVLALFIKMWFFA